ncbi:MAG: NRDE family protein [Nitrospiraceae bacterium]|nr:MAG: NRDE family protein [Nitrospiraceae bacterium]
MCLLLMAFKYHPEYDLIIAANRDEYHTRPSAEAQFWNDKPFWQEKTCLQAAHGSAYQNMDDLQLLQTVSSRILINCLQDPVAPL